MSKKYGNPCATYNIPLNNDENDVFRTGCVHFYHFLHGKSTEYKPLMLKMHLEFVESPLMTEAEGKYIEQQQQLEEEIKALTDALRQAKDYGNQLMDRIDKLEKSNSLDCEKINALLSSSDNAARQSVQQLEAKIKTLEDALLVKDDVVNQLMERTEKLEKNLSNSVLDNCTTQDNSIEKLKQPSINNHSNQQSYGCTIWNIPQPPGYGGYINNVIALAKRIGLSLARDHINNIDVYELGSYLGPANYCVYFCNKDLRDEFLKKSHILKEFSETKDLTISDETEYHTVVIRNITDVCSTFAIGRVVQIAKQMYLWLTRDQIRHVD
ncbi:hypothetical protein DOY81_012212, partial [Sarcophaga bullata]